MRKSILAIASFAFAATVFHAAADDDHHRHSAPRGDGLSFALIGDVPYGLAEEVQFDNVIADVNRSRAVRVVVHTGDVKKGSERCDDAVFLRRFEQFQKFDDAFIVTPGDNDWTDCHRSNNGGYVPTERLARFREIFYPDPRRTTGGRPIRVVPQSTMPGFEPYVENVMWRFGGTTMATLHVVGSNNDLAPWNQIDPTDTYETPRADRIAEYEGRKAAALVWIDRVFDTAVATHSAGVMIAMQADPNLDLPSTDLQRRGFNDVLDRLVVRTIAFGKPVLLAHGDSHYYRVDKPLAGPVQGGGSAMLENFTRVENFGTPNVHWVEVKVDRRDPNVFTIVPHIIDANRFAR
ncbi:MAG: hypothetical protein GC151_10265 [Betaproteobacteria bacterium]|nr:hypothetical protein [Betaproteobacteria bacterium]